jgi:5-methylcytosine-specific restriction endonuclease McrA
MEPRTLLLTAWMQPHDVLDWQQAVKLVVDQEVDVLESYEATIKSAGNRYEGRAPLVLNLPSVLRLRKGFKMYKGGVKYSRSNVYARDHYRCCYCGKRKAPSHLNLDHVLPRDRGGKTTWENIVTSCYDCNGKKGNRIPSEAGLTMHYQPHRPAVLSRGQLLVDLSKVPAAWLPYFGEGAAAAG